MCMGLRNCSAYNVYIALLFESERNGRFFAGSPNSRFRRHAAVIVVTPVLTRAFRARRRRRNFYILGLKPRFLIGLCFNIIVEYEALPVLRSLNIVALPERIN